MAKIFAEMPLGEQEEADLLKAIIKDEGWRYHYVQFGVTVNINRKCAKGFLTIDHSTLSTRGSIFGAGELLLPLQAHSAKPGSPLERAVKFNQVSLGTNPDTAWAAIGLSEGQDANNFTLQTFKSSNQDISLMIARSFVDENKIDPYLEERQLFLRDQKLETFLKAFSDFVNGLKADLPVERLTILPAKI